MSRRLQIGRSGGLFTVFFPHSGAMGRRIRQKVRSQGPLAVGVPSPTGSKALGEAKPSGIARICNDARVDIDAV